MEGRQEKSCSYEGRAYSDGAELCSTDRCMRCRDGNWEERFEDIVYASGP